MTEQKNTEEFVVDGERLLKKVKELIAEGNVRRIVIKSQDDDTIVELPLTVGVVGAVLVPALAGIGAIAALVTECKIIVERKQSFAVQHKNPHVGEGFYVGAGRESRTLVSTLGRQHNSRYTIPAS